MSDNNFKFKNIIKSVAVFCVFAAAVLIDTRICSALPMQPVDWAAESFDCLAAKGAVPESVFFSDYDEDITRENFAILIYTAYLKNTGNEYDADSVVPFNDAKWANSALSAVYELGIMKGDENNLFHPYTPISRQEVAVALNNLYRALHGTDMPSVGNALSEFSDADEIAFWAKSAVGAATAQELLGDYGDGAFHPQDNVTVNQAFVMISRMIDAPDYARPALTSHKNNDVISSDSDLNISWTGNSASGYNVYLVNVTTGEPRIELLYSESRSLKIPSSKLERSSLYYIVIEIPEHDVYSKPVPVYTDFDGFKLTGKQYGDCIMLNWTQVPGIKKYTVTVSERRDTIHGDSIGAKNDEVYGVEGTSMTFYTDPVRIYNITVSAGSYSDSAKFTTDRREIQYGDMSIENMPTTKEEADAVMQKIEVDVWKIRNGDRVASKATLTVHKELAEVVTEIFREIFEGEEQFPISSVGAYAWRGGKTEHNWGTAIDINADENYCLYSSGEVVGDHWLPYEDPYSITPYGDVMRAFERHGFTWGGDAWRGTRDFMHFSYFGT